MYQKILKLLNSILAVFLVICMIIMVITVLIQVVTRFLGTPANATDELSTYLLVWIGLVGAAYTYGLKKHLALELLREKIQGNNRIMLDIFIHILVLLISSTSLLYGGIIFAATAFAHHQISPGISIFGHRLYMGVVFLAMPVAGSFILLFGLDSIFENVKALVKGENNGTI